MKFKMDSMSSNKVWTLVDPPKGVKPVGCKWVYKRKLGADGEVTTFKARLVAKGYTQRPGVDFEETYSPVAMANSIRIMLAIAAWYDYEIWQMDVKTAFLNGFVEKRSIWISRRVSHLLEKSRRSAISKGPSMVSNKLSEAGISVLMRSYGVMISLRTTLTLVYTRRSVGDQLRSSCFMWTTSCSLRMMLRC
ncbi:UNVERIFIED_CONTAM: Retrovirus-related Pol polyprotein from transposon RE2 [Sesamum latifolium]|uniref:Retrovirus-related Pol polyprotein from transposon RE2 n=1 Tax=Sesamum latifolium TaxID=2727402 RepID=A0AAW2WV11_9LAMI